MDVFASFIFLSSTRLLVASMNFLVPINVYTYKHSYDKLSYLFIAPSVEYFGTEHILFAITLWLYHQCRNYINEDVILHEW